MRLNPFKKDPVKKEKTDLFKDVKAKTRQEIKEIEKIADPAERVRRYEAVSKNLEGFYDDGKPLKMGIDTIDTVAKGAIAGDLAGGATAIAASLIFPHIAIPVGLGMIAAGAIGGGVLGKFRGSKAERQRLRLEFGSVRNVRGIHRLQKSLKKRAEKDQAIVEDATRAAQSAEKLRKHFNDTYGKNEALPAPAVTPTTTIPAKLIKRNP